MRTCCFTDASGRVGEVESGVDGSLFFFFFSYFRFSWMVHARLARSLRMSLSAIQFSFFGVLASD